MAHTRILTGVAVPASSGAYSPAVVAGDLCFISGQSPVDPETGEIVGTTAADQTRATLANVLAVLRAAGFSPGELVSVTVLLTDLADRAEVDAVYRDVLEPYGLPARMMTEAGAVPPAGALIEVQAIAARAIS